MMKKLQIKMEEHFVAVETCLYVKDEPMEDPLAGRKNLTVLGICDVFLLIPGCLQSCSFVFLYI